MEQEKAVASYDHDVGFPGTVKLPERYKFDWLRELVDLLRPMEAAMREMCSETATAADIIPKVTAVQMQLEKHHGGNMDVVNDIILDQLGTLLDTSLTLDCVLTFIRVGGYEGGFQNSKQRAAQLLSRYHEPAT